MTADILFSGLLNMWVIDDDVSAIRMFCWAAGCGCPYGCCGACGCIYGGCGACDCIGGGGTTNCSVVACDCIGGGGTTNCSIVAWDAGGCADAPGAPIGVPHLVQNLNPSSHFVPHLVQKFIDNYLIS